MSVLRSCVSAAFGLVSAAVGVLAALATLLVLAGFVVSAGFAVLKEAARPDVGGLR